MKITTMLKHGFLSALVLGVAVGCSSTSQESACTPQQVSQAISAAKAAYAKVLKANNAWRDTGKMIKKAEMLQKEGKCDQALSMANKARQQAEDALAQKAGQEQTTAAKTPAPMSSANQYSVVKGDNLWDISAKPSIYNNPFEWPLIYKANSTKIKDADLIYPGQVFKIDTNPSSADVAAAVHHAKTRGAWTLGKVEASDTAYLAGK